MMFKGDKVVFIGLIVMIISLIVVLIGMIIRVDNERKFTMNIIKEERNEEELYKLHNGIEINLILLLLISPIILYKYIKSERNYKINYSNYYDIDIYYNDVKVSGTGFLDTGNKLKDPYFHKPIILVNSS